MHRAEEPGEVLADLAALAARAQEAVDDVVGHRPLGEPSEPDRQPLHPSRAERLGQHLGRARHAGRDRQGREQRREEPLEGVRRGEHDAADALGMPGHEDLGDGAAAVVPDDGDVAAGRGRRAARRPGRPPRAASGRRPARAGRASRAASRRRCSAARPREPGHDVLPEVGVDEHAVDEHDGRAVARPALEAAEGGVGQRDVARGAEGGGSGHGRNTYIQSVCMSSAMVGRDTTNRAPGSPSVTSMVPPCASATAAAMARPSPVPLVWRLRTGSAR